MEVSKEQGFKVLECLVGIKYGDEESGSWSGVDVALGGDKEEYGEESSP